MKNGSGIVKPKIAEDIADEIENECRNKDEVSISDIESMVYDKLITKKQRLTAKAYEGYRSIREFQRENENTTDEEIHDLVEDKDEYWKDENANKNPVLNPTKRDYIAGSVSTDMTIQTNCFAVIDNSYSGDSDEWKLPVIAMEDTVINKNDRICQFRINKIQPAIEFEEVEHLDEVSRGGIGSTGKA